MSVLNDGRRTEEVKYGSGMGTAHRVEFQYMQVKERKKEPIKPLPYVQQKGVFLTYPILLLP